MITAISARRAVEIPRSQRQIALASKRFHLTATLLHGRTQRLEQALRQRVRGAVRFGDGDRALYATDASNYRHIPTGVVVPRDVDDIVAAVGVAREHEAAVLMRGAGTSLAGQCCNSALVLDTTRFVNRVLDIDVPTRRARVEPGCVLDELRKSAAPHGLTFGPDPSTHSRCSVGGMIGNNACGVHSLQSEFFGPGPQTLHQVERLDVLTYDGSRFQVGPTSDAELAAIISGGGRRGEIYRALAALRDRYGDEIRRRFPKLLRRSSGYQLDQLLPDNGFNVARALVGTEGTCVAVLGATVTLMPNPTHRALLVLGYPNVGDAGDDVMALRSQQPVGLEGMDEILIDFMRRTYPAELRVLPEGRAYLIAEFAGDTPQEATDRARAAEAHMERQSKRPPMQVVSDLALQRRVWEVREAGLGATSFPPGQPDGWEGWEDASVEPQHLGQYLREFRALFGKFGYTSAFYGHFGQGCVHCRINFDFHTKEGLDRYRAFTEEAAHLVTRFGGSLSGEHGDGQSRGELLPIMYGESMMAAFREFKAIWDPDNRMNPGKKIEAASRTENLRHGPTYAPAELHTHFQYPQTEDSFARATLRCVGVGACRRHEGGTMCPSYMVTREERHSTRGRAHLLFEMLQGELIASDWQSDVVKESLDLCFACKGCKSDCPTHVDMATYKAEFLSHYYAQHRRPRHAFAFGLVHTWASFAGKVPRLVNAATQWPAISRVAKWGAGVAPERTIPRVAARTFREWFGRRPASQRKGLGQRVLLWPDTFGDFFLPGTLAAATEVLESVGNSVALPPRGLCCGRPLYDVGMLDRAKTQLREIIAALDGDIAAGTPIVGIEPSCVSVFRDELLNLFPRDPAARRLSSQVFTLGEFLMRRKDEGAELPTLDRKVLVHAHCHHRAIMKTTALEQTLAAIGADYTLLNAGCCGMAGAFGFEKKHYDVSIAAGERALLPAIRAADDTTILIGDGFSCREQIAQTTNRRALHLAEVVQLALHPEVLSTAGRPEDAADRLARATQSS